MIIRISNSCDLAALFNSYRPLTPEDAAETPRDWLGGLWVAGEVYDVNPDETTDKCLVLASGAAAIEIDDKGKRPAADRVEWAAEGDARGVTRDWREVHVWDANGFSETTIYDTLDEAKAAFDREVADLEQLTAELAAEEFSGDEPDDEE